MVHHIINPLPRILGKHPLDFQPMYTFSYKGPFVGRYYVEHVRNRLLIRDLFFFFHFPTINFLCSCSYSGFGVESILQPDGADHLHELGGWGRPQSQPALAKLEAEIFRSQGCRCGNIRFASGKIFIDHKISIKADIKTFFQNGFNKELREWQNYCLYFIKVFLQSVALLNFTHTVVV